jgi:hypothetical protein
VVKSEFRDTVNIYGPMIAKDSIFNNIKINAKKIFIENSVIENLEVLKDEGSNDSLQVLYLNNNVQVKNIDFASGKGLIIVASKNVDLSNTTITGATVKENFS